MHILIVSVGRSRKPSGVCRHAANLARCLADHPAIKKVTLVVGDWQADYFADTLLAGCSNVNLLPVSIGEGALARNWWYMTQLPSLAIQLRCSLVHLAFPMPFIRTLFPMPVVTTLHDLYPFEMPENFGYPNVYFNQGFLRLNIWGSDGLACVSNQTYKQFRSYFPNHRRSLAVVHNYVDFDNVEPTAPQHPLVPGEYVLSVAQHRKNKNLDALIRAYASVRAEGLLPKTFQLVIVGSEGPETSTLKRLIGELQLTDSVRLLSGLRDDEMAWLYQHCRLMAIPSSVEGFCLPVAECLHFERPVICSDIPVLREVGGDFCHYFSLEGNLQQNIKASLTTVLQTAVSQQSTSRDHRFSKAYAANRFLDLYSEFLPQIAWQFA